MLKKINKFFQEPFNLAVFKKIDYVRWMFFTKNIFKIMRIGQKYRMIFHPFAAVKLTFLASWWNFFKFFFLNK